VATVLDLNEQQVQLLIDTLAAVGGSSSVQQEGLEPRVNLHELSLFLLAQIYGREAHRCVAGHEWIKGAQHCTRSSGVCQFATGPMSGVHRAPACISRTSGTEECALAASSSSWVHFRNSAHQLKPRCQVLQHMAVNKPQWLNDPPPLSEYCGRGTGPIQPVLCTRFPSTLCQHHLSTFRLMPVGLN